MNIKQLIKEYQESLELVYKFFRDYGTKHYNLVTEEFYAKRINLDGNSPYQQLPKEEVIDRCVVPRELTLITMGLRTYRVTHIYLDSSTTEWCNWLVHVKDINQPREFDLPLYIFVHRLPIHQ